MANPYRGGTADCWYSDAQDLWVEWKYVLIPKRPLTLIDPTLSALQDHWLRGRWNEGRNIWVIVGSKNGGVIFDQGNWHLWLTSEQFCARLLDRKTIASQLLDWCSHEPTAALYNRTSSNGGVPHRFDHAVADLPGTASRR